MTDERDANFKTHLDIVKDKLDITLLEANQVVVEVQILLRKNARVQR
jgi:hypothetical protein